MRHATDPDHVVAVTTIVSRQRTALHAMIIGALWGLGHTITILVVGAAIILLKLTIPPSVGLTTELSVAFMLILLGVMNLTGLMRRAMEWLAANGYGSGAHAHVIFGRVMIHTHDVGGEFVTREKGSIFDWVPQWCQKLGAFHVLRPPAVGAGTPGAGEGRCSASLGTRYRCVPRDAGYARGTHRQECRQLIESRKEKWRRR